MAASNATTNRVLVALCYSSPKIKEGEGVLGGSEREVGKSVD